MTYEITTFEQYNPFSRAADRSVLVLADEHVRNFLSHLPEEAQEIILEEAEDLSGTRFVGKDGKYNHIKKVISYADRLRERGEPTAAEEDAEFEARQHAAEDREDRERLRGYQD